MSIYYIANNEQILAGTTLKSHTYFESGNLALHVTKDEEKVIENRKRLTATLGVSLNDFTASEQTHSANIHKVTVIDKGRGATTMDTAIQDTDALYTTEAGILLTTFSADCVPVIFHDPIHQLVGVIHSGWQGTIKEITPKVITHLIAKENCHPENIFVHLGASLSQQMFEVDNDVYKQFVQLGYTDDFIYYNETTNKYHIDNQQIVKKQCERSGIPTDQIVSDRTCTFLSNNHFSYRENRHAGRHLNFIMKKS